MNPPIKPVEPLENIELEEVGISLQREEVLELDKLSLVNKFINFAEK